MTEVVRKFDFKTNDEEGLETLSVIGEKNKIVYEF